MRRRAALLVPLLLLSACAHVGARTAAATGTDTPRNYEVGVCGRGLAIANIGGRNQDGEFTHTPNLRLTGGKRSCGIQPRWWFRPGRPSRSTPAVRTANGAASSAPSTSAR